MGPLGPFDSKTASEMAEEVGTTIFKDCNSNEFRCVNPISEKRRRNIALGDCPAIIYHIAF